MSQDAELLRQYVTLGAEASFTQLVTRHLNMVYSAAMRETNGQSALAEEVSQAVFTELARQSRTLLKHPSLAGWLYVTVRNFAANLRRSEQRRQSREQEAQSMNDLVSDVTPQDAWREIGPVLDDALHELPEKDRLAVVLRFLQSRSFREVCLALGLQENAARMRVERAVDKLRGLLEKRGITSGVAGLTAALGLGAIIPAPQALASTIAGTALASGMAACASSFTVLKLMTLTKTTIIGIVIAAGFTIPAWQETRVRRLHSQNLQLQDRESEWRAHEAELTSLRDEVVRLRQGGGDQGELSRLKQWQTQVEPELLRLRGMAGVARRANAEAETLRTQLAQRSVDSGPNPVTGAMANAVKLAMEQQVDAKVSRLKSILNLTSDQEQSIREILGRQAEAMSAGMQQAFSGKFDKAELERAGKNAGNTEAQLLAILTADQKLQYPKYQKEEAAQTARTAASSELMQLVATMGLSSDQQDRAFAALYDVNFSQLSGATKPNSGTQTEIMRWVLDQKLRALEPILTPDQLAKFQQQQALQTKLTEDLLNKMQGTVGQK
jgi:RNA polymerase sigma factor (sigma-70 family)